MARRRNRKGQFVSGGGRRRSRRSRRRRGMGSIITVRRGMGGLGALDAEGLLPVVVGGGLAALTTLATRWFVDPTTGPTQAKMAKYAPLIGTAVGAVGSLALYFMGGTSAAVQSALSAGIVGMFGLGSDMVLKDPEKRAPLLAAIIATAPATDTSTNTGANTGAGAGGFGAIVPEYQLPTPGVGAIAMESVGASGQRAGTIGSYGETVSLSGVNTGAFGTPGFQA